MADDAGLAKRQGGQTRSLDMTRLEQTIGFRLRLAQQHVFRDFAARFSALELSPLLYAALTLIAANPRCRQTELSSALGVRQPNLVEPIESLVKRGLISRSPDPEDRRANVLELTPEGERFMIQVEAVHDEHTRQMAVQLGTQDAARLIRILAKLG